MLRPAELALGRRRGASPADAQGGVTPGGGRIAGLLLVGFLLLPQVSWAGKKPAPPELSEEHSHPTGAFSFRTPPDWKVDVPKTKQEDLLASGGGILLKFRYQRREDGLDSLHNICMMVRLADLMEADPQVQYEYDYIGGQVAGRKALDSAFLVHYDNPILGHREWRQRNLTIVDKGESLCVIAFVPLPTWKKSKEIQTLLAA